MKTIIKISTFILLLFITTSCMFDGFIGIKGNHNVVSENRNLSEKFEKIKVQEGIHLFLTQGSNSSLLVEADENIIDLLITEVKNNELKIYFKKNVYKATSRKVFLTTAIISAIETSSGAAVSSENILKTNTLDLDSSSGSSIKIEVNANEITSNASSGASINVTGKTTLFSADASSGSSINASDLETLDAITEVSSGAQIRVNVSGKLTARASSGGQINYVGEPANIDKETSSGGNVSRS